MKMILESIEKQLSYSEKSFHYKTFNGTFSFEERPNLLNSDSSLGGTFPKFE